MTFSRRVFTLMTVWNAYHLGWNLSQGPDWKVLVFLVGVLATLLGALYGEDPAPKLTLQQRVMRKGVGLQ